jgi:hypothetical protein
MTEAGDSAMSHNISLKRRGVSRATAWIVSIWVVLSVSIASASPEIPPGTGPLPDPLKGAKAGALVNAKHSSLYRKLLPPELAELLDVGEFQFEALLQPREPERWRVPKSVGSDGFELMSSGELRSVPQTGLRASMFEIPRVVQGDNRQLAYKILWNAAGALAQSRIITNHLAIAIFPRADAPPHLVEFLVERLYPLGLGQAVGTEKPLFREKISALKPAAIEKLSWLTLRFFGLGEDFVWAASPMINSIRQMTGSNRSDPIFSRMFAPDDLFVWSGKTELVEPISISSQPVLVMIVEARETTSEKQGPCVTKAFSDVSQVQLNVDSHRLAGAGGWVPTNAVMVVRDVWRIEVSSRDPFTNDVRQAIYIDQDSGLPIYKVVWDQAGRVVKVVVGLLRAVSDEVYGAHAVWGGAIILQPGDGGRTVIVTKELSRCEAMVAGKGLIDFDPSSFVIFEPSQKGRSTQEKKLEQSDKADDILD